jgi:RimJ/RimL family protein N-acetyltransferase/uncharacterized damage-inducible protein DinB
MTVPTALRTERLILRPMSAEEAGAFHRQWNDPQVGRFLWDGKPVSPDTVEAVIAASALDFVTHGFGLWTAWLAADHHHLAGFSGLRVEADTGRIELLYAFDPALWHRGLATEAAKAVLRDAFDRLRVPVIFAGTHPANEASWRVLEKLGMRRLGSRHTAVEELLVYALERGYDAETMSTLPSLPRLVTQLDALPLLLGDASPEALRRRTASGKWSAHENLAHIARVNELFLGRVQRILAENAPAIPQYRAEEDADWPAWAALSTDEVRQRLTVLRSDLVGVAARLTPAELARPGTHSRFGPMPLTLWIEFFLLHEAHHLYTILKRARGAD